MSVGESIHFNRQKEREKQSVFPDVPKVDLNNLMKRAKEEKKKTRRNNLAVSAIALSATVIFGIILTL
jgi:hypothetical protein|tara:strand:- start:230 stop:433 length:204 start_codon:yes stop_codon:yes gene_type:complete